MKNKMQTQLQKQTNKKNNFKLTFPGFINQCSQFQIIIDVTGNIGC